MEDEARAFVLRRKPISSYLSSPVLPSEPVELNSFTSCFKWVCVDQSSLWLTGLSWSVFFLFAVAVPLASHFLLQCSSCDANLQRPYHIPVQISLSVFAAISFVCLSRWSRKYGIRKFLFLDKLCDSSDNVRRGYSQQLQRSVKLWTWFVLPCFAVETAYKLWWFIDGSTNIPYYGNLYVSDTILCALELLSWLYRTSIFILVCVLYRLICYLHILRLEDFAHVFEKETEVVSILKEHLRFRRTLRIISHRFRSFLLLCLILVTASQFIFVLLLTRSGANANIFKAGELSLCSVSLLTGLFICLRSATKVSHKAQSITGLAAKWHICATINSFDDNDGETPRIEVASTHVFPADAEWESEEEEGDGDDDLNNAKIMPIYAHTISFHKRQALVTYLEHNKAGITVYGFMLDRTYLHTIFGIEFALFLWLLNKTIGIS